MLKKIGIVLLGIILANVLIGLVQKLGHMIYPPEADFMTLSPEQLQEVIDRMPLGALMMVWLAYFIGLLGAGFTVGKFGKEAFGMKASYWVGGVMTIFGLLNLIMIPHPLWFAILTMVTYLPCAWFGAKLALR